MRSLSILIASFLIFAPLPANAFTETAGELVSICKGGDTEKTMCTAFVVGVIYGFVAANEHFRLVTGLEQAPKMICPSSGWTGGQGLEVLLKWADEHPEHLDAQPASVVLWAHRDAYPCE